MKAFTYKSAASEKAAVKMLGPKALPLAGGTNLLNLMKDRVVEPDTVVNIKSIKGLDRIGEAKGGGISLGANVRLVALLESKVVRQRMPALWQAVDTIATPQIRNMATVGGNLCARPACWYFTREGYSCPKLGTGRVCDAKEGQNEYHAIFETGGPCVAVHASSAAPALIALGARARVAGPQGSREIDLEKFFALPSADVLRENVLGPNEIVTHVIVPRGTRHTATYVVRHKTANDWPVGLASVALALGKDGTCGSARVVLGCVAPIPWRSKDAEKALAGKKITAATATAAAAAAVKGAKPLSHNGYKVRTARTAVKRAILTAATGKW